MLWTTPEPTKQVQPGQAFLPLASATKLKISVRDNGFQADIENM